jgi:hypothetical protein
MANDPRFKNVWWIHEPRDFEWRRDPPDIRATDPVITITKGRLFALDNADVDSCTLLGSGEETGSTGNADYTLSYGGSGDPGIGVIWQGEETGGKNGSGTLYLQYQINGTGGFSNVTEWDGSTNTHPFWNGNEVGMADSNLGGQFWPDSGQATEPTDLTPDAIKLSAGTGSAETPERFLP